MNGRSPRHSMRQETKARQQFFGGAKSFPARPRRRTDGLRILVDVQSFFGGAYGAAMPVNGERVPCWRNRLGTNSSPVAVLATGARECAGRLSQRRRGGKRGTQDDRSPRRYDRRASRCRPSASRRYESPPRRGARSTYGDHRQPLAPVAVIACYVSPARQRPVAVSRLSVSNARAATRRRKIRRLCGDGRAESCRARACLTTRALIAGSSRGR